MTDLVSIILPTFNRAQLIQRAISSVLNQTYQHWELVVVDDGSTDETSSVVKSFNDPRIHYFKKANSGAGASRNFGIQHAMGSWITFLDSDDEYDPAKVEMQLRAALENNAELVVCGSVYLKDGAEFRRKVPELKTDLTRALRERQKGTGVSTPIFFVKRELLSDKEILFDSTLPAYQDWDFLYQLSFHTNYAVVQHHLYRVHFQRGQRVHSGKNVLKAFRILLKKYGNHFSESGVYADWLKNTILLSLKFGDIDQRELKEFRQHTSTIEFIKLLGKGFYQNVRIKIYQIVKLLRK